MNKEDLDKVIRRVPDFPKPGILFYDITSVFANPDAFKYCIEQMVLLYKDRQIDGIVAVESRGFLFAAPLAERLKLPLVLVRKKGKLPGKTYKASYTLEYGSAEIEMHQEDVLQGKSYLIVDDLIATGGTLLAAKNLVEQGKAKVAGFFGVIGLPDLNYKEALKPYEVNTLINFKGA